MFVLAGVVYTSSSDNINYELLPSPPSFLMYITVTDGKWYDTDHLSVQVQNVNELPVFSQTHYSSSRTEGAVGVQSRHKRYGIVLRRLIKFVADHVSSCVLNVLNKPMMPKDVLLQLKKTFFYSEVLH